VSVGTERGGRGSRLLVIAIVFDSIAVAGLCLVAIGAYLRGGALGLVFLGGAAGLAALPGAVLSGIALRGAARRRAWPRRRFAVTVAGLALAAALIGPVALLLGWNATPNPAATAAVPLEDEIRAAGGSALCTNGDAGRGPDNFSPWHEAYFTAPRSQASPARLQQLAAAAGYVDLRRAAGRASSFGDSERFTLRSGAASAHRTDLTVEVSPTGTQLDCDSDYGRTFRPAHDQVVIDLTTTIDEP